MSKEERKSKRMTERKKRKGIEICGLRVLERCRNKPAVDVLVVPAVSRFANWLWISAMSLGKRSKWTSRFWQSSNLSGP